VQAVQCAFESPGESIWQRDGKASPTVGANGQIVPLALPRAKAQIRFEQCTQLRTNIFFIKIELLERYSGSIILQLIVSQNP